MDTVVNQGGGMGCTGWEEAFLFRGTLTVPMLGPHRGRVASSGGAMCVGLLVYFRSLSSEGTESLVGEALHGW